MLGSVFHWKEHGILGAFLCLSEAHSPSVLTSSSRAWFLGNIFHLEPQETKQHTLNSIVHTNDLLLDKKMLPSMAFLCFIYLFIFYNVMQSLVETSSVGAPQSCLRSKTVPYVSLEVLLAH